MPVYNIFTYIIGVYHIYNIHYLFHNSSVYHIFYIHFLFYYMIVYHIYYILFFVSQLKCISHMGYINSFGFCNCISHTGYIQTHKSVYLFYLQSGTISAKQSLLSCIRSAIPSVVLSCFISLSAGFRLHNIAYANRFSFASCTTSWSTLCEKCRSFFP